MTKECDYSDNNENGKDIVDESNAKNCNYGSNNSGYTDNNDAGDGNSSNSNSSNSNKGNKAYGCVGRQGLLTTINSRAKPRLPIYNRLYA